MYVIKKYVRAISALDAIRQEKDHSVDECTMENNWKDFYLSEVMGFDPLEDED
jgi:hypothetical protein